MLRKKKKYVEGVSGNWNDIIFFILSKHLCYQEEAAPDYSIREPVSVEIVRILKIVSTSTYRSRCWFFHSYYNQLISVCNSEEENSDSLERRYGHLFYYYCTKGRNKW